MKCWYTLRILFWELLSHSKLILLLQYFQVNSYKPSFQVEANKDGLDLVALVDIQSYQVLQYTYFKKYEQGFFKHLLHDAEKTGLAANTNFDQAFPNCLN